MGTYYIDDADAHIKALQELHFGMLVERLEQANQTIATLNYDKKLLEGVLRDTRLKVRDCEAIEKRNAQLAAQVVDLTTRTGELSEQLERAKNRRASTSPTGSTSEVRNEGSGTKTRGGKRGTT